MKDSDQKPTIISARPDGTSEKMTPAERVVRSALGLKVPEAEPAAEAPEDTAPEEKFPLTDQANSLVKTVQEAIRKNREGQQFEAQARKKLGLSAAQE